jgi:predicted lipoprotein with Yx(FWY)xxD motif
MRKHDGKTREPRAESNVQMPCASDWPQLAVNERKSANTSNLPIPQISETAMSHNGVFHGPAKKVSYMS